jgi:hypothetical protein
LTGSPLRKRQRPAIAAVETFKHYPHAGKIPLPRTWILAEDHLTPCCNIVQINGEEESILYAASVGGKIPGES